MEARVASCTVVELQLLYWSKDSRVMERWSKLAPTWIVLERR